MKPVLSIVMTHGDRALKIDRVIENILEMTVESDIAIWDNSKSIMRRDVNVFSADNKNGAMQKYLPALVSNNEFVFYQDDDIKVGTRFIEEAIIIINKNPEALVVSGGSIIYPPFTKESIDKRIWFYGFDRHNKSNMFLDVGCSGCFVCRREMLKSIFCLGYFNIKSGDDIILSLSHQIFNGGTIILSRHDEVEKCGIREFYNDHFSGKSKEKDFCNNRTDLILDIIKEHNWQPKAAWKNKHESR